MSGGHFDYNQFTVREIAEEIDRIIATSVTGYSQETITRFKEASHTLNRAADMAQRIDWLLCGDDGEDSFLRRWKQEVGPELRNE